MNDKANKQIYRIQDPLFDEGTDLGPFSEHPEFVTGALGDPFDQAAFEEAREEAYQEICRRAPDMVPYDVHPGLLAAAILADKVALNLVMHDLQ